MIPQIDTNKLLLAVEQYRAAQRNFLFWRKQLKQAAGIVEATEKQLFEAEDQLRKVRDLLLQASSEPTDDKNGAQA